jgi:hypothetical protein
MRGRHERRSLHAERDEEAAGPHDSGYLCEELRKVME